MEMAPGSLCASSGSGLSFYDLASLTKPLVTAALAHAYLDLDADRRWQLGFHERAEPLTVRQLLSHSSGLPPWLPFTGEPLAAQLRRSPLPGNHSLLRSAQVGESTYSDLGYRAIAELLEKELGLSWKQLGAAASGLAPAPWSEAPVPLPPGQDAVAWAEAEPDLPFPDPGRNLPHDANARAGMIGAAGFGATAIQLQASLERWMGAKWPDRMAVETARSQDGDIWGLGLQRVTGLYADLLGRIPLGAGGVHVMESASMDIQLALAPAPEMLASTAFWQHLAYTGPALFVRLEDRCCIALLCHRLGADGSLLSLEQLRVRRVEILKGFLG